MAAIRMANTIACGQDHYVTHQHDHDHDHDHHHNHDHDHDHDHDHGQDSDHDHDHENGHGGWLRNLLRPHSHDAADKVDAELEASRDGIRALWLSLLILGVTAAVQAAIVVWSGSVALLGDTL